MKPIGVFYATRQGHTQRIAEHITAMLRAHGKPAEIRNLRHEPEMIVFDDYAGVVLAASVHFGIHEYEMTKFAKKHRKDLERMSSAFISVNLTEAGVENPQATAEQRSRAAAVVEHMLDDFYARTSWRPKYVKAVAGALPYVKTNFLGRFLMKRVAASTGIDTDTSHNYVYTNWTSLDHFIDDFAAEVQLSNGPCPTPSSAPA